MGGCGYGCRSRGGGGGIWASLGRYGQGWAKVCRSGWVRLIRRGWVTWIVGGCGCGCGCGFGNVCKFQGWVFVGLGKFGQIWARVGKGE